MERISTILAVILVLFCLIQSAQATTYYIDATNGSDGSNGLSPETAWKIISKVNSMSFNPGDSILFKRGEIWREQLTVPSSGSAGNPITFGAYGSGDLPKITGADLASGWTGPDGNGEYYISVSGVVYVVIRNGTLVQRGSGIGSLNDDEWYYYGLKLYYKPPSDHSPTEYAIEYGVRLTAITVNDRDYITIEDLHTEAANTNWNSGDSPGNIHLLLANNITIRNCLIKNSPLNGISISGSSNVIVENNTIQYCAEGILGKSKDDTSEISEYLTVRNNNISHIGYNHYRLSDDMEGVGFNQVNNSIIEHNDISYCGNPETAIEGKGNGIVIYLGSGNKVQYNRVHDYYQSGIVVSTTNVEVSYNVIYNGSSVADSAAAMAWYCGIRASQDGENMKIYNNIIYRQKARSTVGNGHRNANICVFVGPYSTQSTIVKNNIMTELDQSLQNGFDHSVVVLEGGTLNLISDYNNIYRNDLDTIIYNNYYGNGEYTQAQFSTYQNDTGLDANSISNNPIFIDTANNDFHLDSSSPCIDAGINVGLTLDFDGNPVPHGPAPDIGAYEYVSGAPSQTCSQLSGTCCSSGQTCTGTFQASSNCGSLCCVGGTCQTPTQTCSDGTLYSQCSTTKPMYCSSGTLTNNCQTCGCPAGQSCQASGACQSCLHKSDSSCDGCVDTTELSTFIGRWNVNNQDVTLKELMEAIGFWKKGC